MIINQANLQGLYTGYSTAFNKSFSNTETNHQKIATVVPSSTGEQNYKWLGQMPQMREWIGEREVQSMAAYDYILKNRKFEMTCGVPREDIEDDQYGLYTPIISSMGESAAQHPDDLCFTALMEGFERLCYDGKPFFADNHQVEDHVYSNRTDVALTVDSYVAARTAIMSIRGDKEKSLRLVPDLLVVSPALEAEAKQILEAELISGTTNIWKGTAQIHVDTNLSKRPRAWYLLCTKRFLKPIIFQERKMIKFVSLTKDTDINVFLKDEYVYGADGRSNAGYGFWQMAYGSTGEAQG